MSSDDAKCLKGLKAENATRKRLLAVAGAKKAALKRIIEGRW